jgi:hypothetical protein
MSARAEYQRVRRLPLREQRAYLRERGWFPLAQKPNGEGYARSDWASPARDLRRYTLAMAVRRATAEVDPR